MSLFDDTPTQQQPPQQQFTGFNQGYQQGSAVDFFANPIDQVQQPQPTGFVGNTFTGYPQQYRQTTGFPNNFNGFGAQGGDVFGQQQPQQQQQPLQSFQPQQTGFPQAAGNHFFAQQGQPSSTQSAYAQPGTNNPWSTQQSASPIASMPTGSNNPFASTFGRPQAQKASTMSTLGSLPEQKTLSTFNQGSSGFPVASASSTPGSFPQAPQRELNEHEAKLNALLAGGDGMDTFGNTGQLRIPAQHTAPGTFVNSAGSGTSRLTEDATGSNPFLRSQFTGMPSANYGPSRIATSVTGAPATAGNQSYANNPFAPRSTQQNGNQQDLIQF
jgi:epsin